MVSASAGASEQSRAEWRRTRLIALLTFLAALVALYVATQLRQQRVVALGVLAVYVVAATLWVRVQYEDQLAGWPSGRPRTWPAWLAVVVGVVLVAAGGTIAGVDAPDWARTLVSWLTVAGIGSLYLGIGHLIATSRSHPRPGSADRSWWRRLLPPYSSWLGHVVWLVALLATSALGVCLLAAGTDATTAGLLAVVPLLLAPWALSLLSESAIRRLVGSGTATWQWLWPTLGVLGLAAAAGALKGGLYAAAVLALAGLVVAIASATMADIAVVLALVALAGMTPAQDDPDRPLPGPAADDRPNGRGLLVALGDSYMSGEGASVYIDGTDEGGENECRRAETAWPALSGRLGPFDSFVSFACSGADSYNVRHTPEGARGARRELAQLHPDPVEQFPGIMTQLDAYDDFRAESEDPAAFRPALVVLSIGGNDAGFASVGVTCLAPGSCNDEEPSRLWRKGNLDRVERRVRQVYADVDRTFPDTPVAVIPYVNPIGSDAPCDEAALEQGDVTFLRTFLRALNQRIERSAAVYGFHFVRPVQSALAVRNLRLCDDASGDRPGLNFIGLRSVGGLADQQFNPAKWTHTSLHPNERGHTAIHEAFQRWLASAQQSRRRTPGQPSRLEVRLTTSAPPRPGTELLREREGRCATYDTDDALGCKSQSQAWALQQLGQALLLPIGPWAVLTALLAWIAAVRLFARRRAQFADQAP